MIPLQNSAYDIHFQIILPKRTRSIILKAPVVVNLFVKLPLHRLNVLGQPSDGLSVTCVVSEIILCVDRRICIPCLITTEHMKTSIGLMPSKGTLPLPVV